MAAFTYDAVTNSGELTQGKLEAKDRPSALAELAKRGLQPRKLLQAVSVEEANGDPKEAIQSKKKQPAINQEGLTRLGQGDLLLFTEELADLLAAGVPLDGSLAILERRENLTKVSAVAKKARSRIREGVHLSVALPESSPSFGDLYCSLVAAGEVSGALGPILKRQAEYLKSMAELRSRVMAALSYPAFLATAGVGVAILFVTFLIPKLMILLDATGGSLPAMASTMMAVSDFIKQWWWLIIGLVGIVVILFRSVIQSESVRPEWDRVKLRIPLIGAVLSTQLQARFLETLANLLANGIPLLNALELVRDATGNVFAKSRLARLIAHVGEGGGLCKGLESVGFLSPDLVDLVRIGEETGNLEGSMAKASARANNDLDKRMETISALIQPTIIVVMALLVGCLAYVMVGVIYDTIGGLRSR